MPRMRDVIIVQNRRSIKFPAATSTRADASFSPTPVFVTIPMIMPADAQAMSTPKAPRAPLTRPSIISLKSIRVFARSMAVAMEIMIPASAAFIGVYPEASSPIIAISGIARCPSSFMILTHGGSSFLGVPFSLFFFASK